MFDDLPRLFPDYHLPDTFVISGQLGATGAGYDEVAEKAYRGRGGKFFFKWSTAYRWVAERYTVVDIIYEAQLSSRWAFRVMKPVTRRSRIIRLVPEGGDIVRSSQ